MTTPAGWYPDPSGSGNQRYFDGISWTNNLVAPAAVPPPPTTTKPKRGQLIGVLVGAAVVVWIGSSVFGSDNDKPDHKSSSVTSTAAAPAAGFVPSTKTKAPPAPMGTEVRDGKFAFVVTGIDQSTTAGDPTNEFMIVKPQGKFFNVHLRVTNIGNEPQTFFASNQKLVVNGAEYEPNTMASVWDGTSNEAINPGNTINATVSFDVPVSANSAEIIKLHDSVFSGGVEAALG